MEDTVGAAVGSCAEVEADIGGAAVLATADTAEDMRIQVLAEHTALYAGHTADCYMLDLPGVVDYTVVGAGNA